MWNIIYRCIYVRRWVVNFHLFLSTGSLSNHQPGWTQTTEYSPPSGVQLAWILAPSLLESHFPYQSAIAAQLLMNFLLLDWSGLTCSIQVEGSMHVSWSGKQFDHGPRVCSWHGQYCGGHSGNLSLSDWYNNISYGCPNKRMMGKLRVDHSWVTTKQNWGGSSDITYMFLHNNRYILSMNPVTRKEGGQAPYLCRDPVTMMFDCRLSFQ